MQIKIQPIDVEELKKNVRSRKSRYNEDVHIDLLAQTMQGFEGISAFCDEAGISLRTFHYWIDRYPNFKEAYEILKVRSQRLMELKLLNDKEIHHPTWTTFYNNRHPAHKDKQVPPKNTLSFTERLEDTWQAFESGKLSLADYHQQISALNIHLKTALGALSYDKLMGHMPPNMKGANIEQLEEKINAAIKLFTTQQDS